MKNVGVTRKVDMLGRIVIPKELRRTMNIDIGTPLEIFVDDDTIILRKYAATSACWVTGEVLPDNKEYAGGVTLSPKGAKMLLEQIAVHTLT